MQNAIASNKIGEGIQLVQQGQLAAAQKRLASAKQPYKGEALFLAARIAEQEQNWNQAMSYYRQYLSEDPFSVHRLEARAAFALLRGYRSDPLLADFLYLVQLRDQYALTQMQQTSARLYASNPSQPLAIRGQLLVAHSLLELAQQPQQALQLYLTTADATKEMKADWYIQAMFGAVFSALRSNQNTLAIDLFEQLQAKLDSRWASQNSLLARSWQQRVDAMAFMLKLNQDAPPNTTSPFLWGVGARLLLDSPVGSGQNFTPIWNTLEQHGLNVKSVTLWITQDSDWHWLRADLLRGAHAKGYIPMISYWYFGDKISPEYVQANRERYLNEIENKLIPLLQDLPQAYLILEPEFNKNGIESWDGWDPLMLEVMALIRKGAPQVKIGLGLGDWDQPGSTPSYASAYNSIEASDFVASMLMLSSYTERAHSAPDWSGWVRALRLGERLQKRFNKPWMLAYLSIASQPNWEAQQANELEKLHFYLPLLRQLGLFALNWFSFTDEPLQQGWFADAEQSFGLLNAEYNPKPALDVYKRLIEQHELDSSIPNVIRFDVTTASSSVLQSLKIDLALTHWAQWKIVISQGSNHWSSKGAGESATLDWHGQMLPTWATSGTVLVNLVLNGQATKQRQIAWQGAFNNDLAINENIVLSTWQTWQRETIEQLNAQQLGKTNSGSLELVFTGLNPTQLSGLYIGLVDSQGYLQTLSSTGYAYENGSDTAFTIPLSDFNNDWVKYDNGVPVWREQPSEPISIVVQNTNQQPTAFKVSRVRTLLPNLTAQPIIFR
ncbi:hypothetical protein [Photobacterium sanctipauli]|nr:hypothetical protein [Photobacterium sanctipauli]